LKIRLAIITGLLAALGCATSWSQDYTRFPGESADQRTLQTQKRVDELYAAGDYVRALFIFEKELAPRGDKYAQYMVGFMHLNGFGTPQDTATALAWYRLAAEREQEVLQQARDELAVTMTREQIEASNRIFVDLLKKMGDTTLLMRLIRQDMNTLEARTGTRIVGSEFTGPMLIYRRSGVTEGPNFYRDVRRRLEARLNYLETKIEISDLPLESDNDELREFEEQIRSDLIAIEIP
jgi:hypothetical protein